MEGAAAHASVRQTPGLSPGAEPGRQGRSAAFRFRAQLRPAAALPPVLRGWLRLDDC